MKIIQCSTNQGIKFVIEFDCGFRTPERFTLEAAGRDADLHMAETFPIGTQRRPCFTEASK